MPCFTGVENVKDKNKRFILQAKGKKPCFTGATDCFFPFTDFFFFFNKNKN